MNVFTNIKQIKYEVEQLKKELPYIKNQAKLEQQVRLINTIIMLVNHIEWLLDQKRGVEMVDKLLLARLYSQMFPIYKPEESIDLKQVMRNVQDDLNSDKENLKQKIIDFLRMKEVDFELIKPEPQLHKITKESEYDRMLEDLIYQLKANAQWN